jgi:GAF domain-containing protein
MAAAHHDVLLAAVRRASTPAEVARVTEAAGDFFLESLSAYEMIRRGFVETQDAARIERRHAGMLRQLSTFLADASLAVDADASAEEILRLVAEQARDLLGADWCVASTLPHGGTPGAEAVSSATAPAPDDPAAWSGSPWAFATVPPRHDRHHELRVASSDGPADGDEAAAMPPSAGADELAAPLTALDRRHIGEIRAGGRDGRFTDVDRAVLVHLAQMTAAALERTRLYRTP